MFRFTIRDVLWLMVVVAVALTLWLGWTRETATLREESAVREAKLQNDVAAERHKAKERTMEILQEYNKSKIESLTQKAIAKELQERYSARKSEIIRLEDEVRRLKAKKSATLFDP